jgi:hypothetical protein
MPTLNYPIRVPSVFLPEGTRLRACFGGHHYFAQVEGGEIKYGEHAMSPSRFANLQGSGNRNAWKARTRWPPQAPCNEPPSRISVMNLKKAAACCQDRRKGRRHGIAPMNSLNYRWAAICGSS